MRTRSYRLALLAVLPLLFAPACFADPTYTTPEEAAEGDEDFAYQGEYVGETNRGARTITVAMQLVARGEGAFLVKPFVGGLPGEGGKDPDPTVELTREGDTLEYGGEVQFQFALGEDEIIVSSPGVDDITFSKVHRESPTLGAEPPEGAIVLFDGTNLDHWLEDAEMTEDGLLKQGCTTADEFQSHRLHLEFLLPYMPEDEGQARANSGCYVQGRYEIQILDSFGLEGLENECGGIYNVAPPAVNMCLPPLTWQTYDIEFHAAQYDENGELVAHPHMTVEHNGVVIHDDIELAEGTPGGTGEPGPEAGPLYLQHHGNPVRFRNVWALPLEEE